MPSNIEFVQYICDQIKDAGSVRYFKMMGEYCIYCDDKVIGLVCDNQFFLKTTKATAQMMKDNPLGYPYPGAKAAYLIHDVDDREFLTDLVRLTAFDLPAKKRVTIEVKT